MAEQTEIQKALARQNQLFAMYRKSKVLVIEDSAQARGILRGMLRDLTVEHIDMAMSGQDGIEHLTRHQYDIVLCDYNLGKGKDGQQVLEEARFGKYLKYSTVFIMITAETSVEMVMGALEYQPDSYLSKPFTKNELQLRLDRAIHAKLDYKSIDQAFEKEDYETAIELCEARMLSESAPQMRAQRIKAESLVKLGRYTDANQLYRSVCSEREVPWAQIGIGKTAYYLQQLDDAQAIFARLIAERPNVVESYDWMAKVLIKSGKPREAQDVLEEACSRSPKAVLRQMELAKLSLSNRSYLIAEKAYRKAILLANDSCYRTPENFLQYARTLLVKIEGAKDKLARDALDEALLFLNRMRKEFAGSHLVDFRATMLESLILHYAGKSEEAKKTLARAQGMFGQLNEKSQQTFADEFVTTMSLTGDFDASMDVIRAMQNSQVKPDVLKHLLARIENSKRRIESESLNRQAMDLYERGQLLEAHKAFSKAASTQGASANILLNAVEVCLELAERQDLNQEEWRRECQTYLKRLGDLDRCDHRYPRFTALQERFYELAPAA